MCDELQKMSNKNCHLTFVYVVQTLTNETVPCSGLTASTHHEVTDEQLVRSPALRPSSNSELKACNTWEYVPSMFLRYILNLVRVHSVRLLDIIRQCDKLVSPSILLLICELRLNSFYFWGSGYSHGGSTLKPPSLKLCFLFPRNTKIHAKQISNWNSNEKIRDVEFL